MKKGMYLLVIVVLFLMIISLNHIVKAYDYACQANADKSWLGGGHVRDQCPSSSSGYIDIKKFISINVRGNCAPTCDKKINDFEDVYSSSSIVYYECPPECEDYQLQFDTWYLDYVGSSTTGYTSLKSEGECYDLRGKCGDAGVARHHQCEMKDECDSECVNTTTKNIVLKEAYLGLCCKVKIWDVCISTIPCTKCRILETQPITVYNSSNEGGECTTKNGETGKCKNCVCRSLCSPDQCTIGDWRCNGLILQKCEKNESGCGVWVDDKTCSGKNPDITWTFNNNVVKKTTITYAPSCNSNAHSCGLSSQSSQEYWYCTSYNSNCGSGSNTHYCKEGTSKIFDNTRYYCCKTYGGNYRWQISQCNNPPKIKAIYPTGGTSIHKNVPFNFSVDVSDPDGDSLTLNIFYYSDSSCNNMVKYTTINVNGNTRNWINKKWSQTISNTGWYYWKATVDDGIHTNTTGCISFSVVNDPPNKPILISPQNGATHLPKDVALKATVGDPNGDDLNVTFEYGTSSGHYTDSHYVWPVQSGDTTSYQAHLDWGTTYYWIVRADDKTNHTESDEWHFTTDYKPEIVVNAPNGYTTPNVDITVRATDKDPEDDGKLSLSITVQGAKTCSFTGLRSGESKTCSFSLGRGQTYTWNVKACDQLGACTSQSGSFTINIPPKINWVKDNPDPVDVGSVINFTIDWSDPDGNADKLTVYRENGGDVLTFGAISGSSGVTTLSYKVIPYDLGVTKYYVEICDSVGECSSAVYDFTAKTNASVELFGDYNTVGEMSDIFINSHYAGSACEGKCDECNWSTGLDEANMSKTLSDNGSTFGCENGRMVVTFVDSPYVDNKCRAIHKFCIYDGSSWTCCSANCTDYGCNNTIIINCGNNYECGSSLNNFKIVLRGDYNLPSEYATVYVNGKKFKDYCKTPDCTQCIKTHRFFDYVNLTDLQKNPTINITVKDSSDVNVGCNATHKVCLFDGTNWNCQSKTCIGNGCSTTFIFNSTTLKPIQSNMIIYLFGPYDYDAMKSFVNLSNINRVLCSGTYCGNYRWSEIPWIGGYSSSMCSGDKLTIEFNDTVNGSIGIYSPTVHRVCINDGTTWHCCESKCPSTSLIGCRNNVTFNCTTWQCIENVPPTPNVMIKLNGDYNSVGEYSNVTYSINGGPKESLGLACFDTDCSQCMESVGLKSHIDLSGLINITFYFNDSESVNYGCNATHTACIWDGSNWKCCSEKCNDYGCANSVTIENNSGTLECKD